MENHSTTFGEGNVSKVFRENSSEIKCMISAKMAGQRCSGMRSGCKFSRCKKRTSEHVTVVARNSQMRVISSMMNWSGLLSCPGHFVFASFHDGHH